MPRQFGRYRSRRSKPEPNDKKTSEPKKKKGGGLGAMIGARADRMVSRVGRLGELHVRDAKKVAHGVAKMTEKAAKMTERAAKTADYMTGGSMDLEEIEEDHRRIGGGLLPNRLHVPIVHKNHLAKMVSVMDDHDFKGLKHGAKYILGHATDVVHHHRHRATQHVKHFQQIARATREKLTHMVHHGPEALHRAIHESMHSAKVGGGFSFEHVDHIAKHLDAPVGGSLGRTLEDVAEDFGDVADEVNKAKASYDNIDFNDRSVSGLANTVTKGYSGNFHLGAAYMNAAGAVLRPARDVFRGAGEGFGVVGTELGKL